MSVKKIHDRTVHQICSGQVILTLAVAAKELVENSLDAGATSIEVRVKEYGSELLEVVDNGSGVAPGNYQALTLKHHTSKLEDFSDLATVQTFGFRGEALSSLCALSDLVVTTRHVNQPVGVCIEYDSNGKIRSQVQCAREVGTSVSLHNLFYTLPVRQGEFHRNLKREYGKMVQMLQGYCLVANRVRIMCYHQVGKGKRVLVLSTSGCASMLENVASIFGQKQVTQLVEFAQCPWESIKNQDGVDCPSEDFDCFKVSGHISRCNHGYGRSTTDRQFFSFNGRPCDHLKLSRTINEIYHVYNRHQFPFVVLNIETSREGIDVNLTPDKRQVMVHQEKTLLLLVRVSLERMYEFQQKQLDRQDQSQPLAQKHGEGAGPSPVVAMEANTKTPSPLVLSSLKRKFSHVSSVEDGRHTQRQQSSPLAKQPCLSDYGITLTKTPKSAVSSLGTSSLITPSASSSTSGQSSFASSHTLTSTGKGVARGGTFTSLSQSYTGQKGPLVTSLGRPLSDTDTNSSESHDLSEGNCSSKYEDDSGVICEDDSGAMCVDNAIVADCSSKGAHWDQESPLDETIDDKCYHGNRDQPVRALPFSMENTKARLKLTPTEETGGSEKKKRYFRAQIRPDCNTSAEEELRKELSKSNFKDMEVLGQFNLGFIVARLDDDLFIIDQHATDEKYNFERLQRETVIEHQRLIQPLSLDLTAVNESVVMDNIEVFKKNGFEFLIDEDALPTKRVKLIGQPVSKNWTLGPSDIDELIFLLCDSPGQMVRPSRVTSMFASRACRGSIMIGTALSRQEMKRLLDHMSEMNQPWNCPHGRPTLRHLIDLSRLLDS